jgi:hypothetical protein
VTTSHIRQYAVALAAVGATTMVTSAAGSSRVDLTWMSIANMYYRIGSLGIVTDGYLTRIPEEAFFGGGGGLAETRRPYKPDVEAVSGVLRALGGATSVGLLLTGHSHFDHSFDTATWAKLTGARIIGSRTTCFQARAENVPAERCTAVNGGEAIALSDGVALRVVRWNHSGDAASNPEQHNPVELASIPRPDPLTGGLRAGVAEDFPNGGGSRGFLFTVDGPGGRLSWFYENSASAVDLAAHIVIEGVDYGAPIENLKSAMRDARLESVDLWIGTGGAPVAQLVLPILRPKTYLPVHWDGFYAPFRGGMPKPFADLELERLLVAAKVTLVRPLQYMDKWRLDRSGVRAVANTAVKRALGFADAQVFSP